MKKIAMTAFIMWDCQVLNTIAAILRCISSTEAPASTSAPSIMSPDRPDGRSSIPHITPVLPAAGRSGGQ